MEKASHCANDGQRTPRKLNGNTRATAQIPVHGACINETLKLIRVVQGKPQEGQIIEQTRPQAVRILVGNAAATGIAEAAAVVRDDDKAMLGDVCFFLE